jgi:hypothetical protein
VLGEPEFNRGLLIAVTKSVTDRVRHDHFCDRTHIMIGNNVQFEGLIDIVIADGGGGSGGGGGGRRGRGRKSRCGRERVKNCNRTVDSGGKKTLFPTVIATTATILVGVGEEGGWAGNVGGDDKAPRTMTAAAAALAALLSA